jgi:DNA invertase Pin-like site-specific DNA recombinase
MRAIGYTRVSTQEQASDGAGLAAQRATIDDTCDARRWPIPYIVEDVCSGGTPWQDRPALSLAIAELERHAYDVLVVAKLDRLSRSTLDFATLLERSRNKKWPMIILDFGLDLTTPVGEMVANILAAVSQFERRRIGERTREGLAQKKAQGVKLGRVSTVDPVTTDRIIQWRREGITYQAIANALNTERVPTGQGADKWSESAVRYVYKAGRSE